MPLFSRDFVTKAGASPDEASLAWRTGGDADIDVDVDVETDP